MRNPYITGAYVTGSNHYGRGHLLDYLLRSEGRAYWVVGTRRIGKTSLLRQLELLAAAGDRYVPLFWDMQGCASFTCMGGYLGDAVRDHLERFEPLGVTDAMLDQEDPLALLSTLRRLVRRAGRELLLLGDETEALIGAARDEPEAMQRFHRQLTGGAGLRVIFASTRQIYRMHDVCREWTTSPFLSGFDMSQTLGSLEPEAAEALILQTQAPEDSQVHAAAEIVEAITRATNDHPFLLQILCSRLFDEDGALAPPATRTCGSIRSWLASSSTTSGNCRRPTAASCWQCIGPAQRRRRSLRPSTGTMPPSWRSGCATWRRWAICGAPPTPMMQHHDRQSLPGELARRGRRLPG